MLIRCFFVLALSLACAACDLLTETRVATLELTIPSTSREEWHTATDDPNGLAGLKIQLSGTVSDSFVANEFPVAPFSVPLSGTIHIAVSLHQGSEPVAHREVDWTLRSDATRWELQVSRTPSPRNAMVDGADLENRNPDPRCGWFWCHRVWRVEIDEDARNYDDEALWLVLWKFDDDSCADICW